MFVFSLVTLSGATTYWQRGNRTKKETLQQAKVDNRTTYWRRYITTTKRYPTTSSLRIYNNVPAYNEPNKIFVKQIQGIKLYKRRCVSDSGYIKKYLQVRLSRNQKVIFIFFFFLPLQREKFNSALTVLCCTKNTYTQ